jgi:hypothetical protein
MMPYGARSFNGERKVSNEWCWDNRVATCGNAEQTPSHPKHEKPKMSQTDTPQ